MCAASTSSPTPAASWNREQKVIARIEATERGTDARFIVTKQ
jgi:hypothetical protein